MYTVKKYIYLLYYIFERNKIRNIIFGTIKTFSLEAYKYNSKVGSLFFDMHQMCKSRDGVKPSYIN